MSRWDAQVRLIEGKVHWRGLSGRLNKRLGDGKSEAWFGSLQRRFWRCLSARSRLRYDDEERAGLTKCSLVGRVGVEPTAR